MQIIRWMLWSWCSGIFWFSGTGVAKAEPPKVVNPSTSATEATSVPRPRFEVERIADILYRADSQADPERHRLDLYRPIGAKDFPVLFFVHGGSWRSGNKNLYAKLGENFAKFGVGAVIINYRLSPKVQHPAHIEDVAKAFAWVYTNIAKYGGRKDQIFVSGHSAGGHLVGLLATDESYLKAEKLTLDVLRGVIALSGVFQISPRVPIFHAAFGRDEQVCRQASPITHVRDKHPPFLLMYADRDFPTLDRMAEDFCQELKKHSVEAVSRVIKDRNHYTIIINMVADERDPCIQATLEFISKRATLPKPSTESK